MPGQSLLISPVGRTHTTWGRSQGWVAPPLVPRDTDQQAVVTHRPGLIGLTTRPPHSTLMELGCGDLQMVN